jgi:hypothetical protein
MTSGHFIYVPAILMLGIVVGWILGSRRLQTRMPPM